MQLKKSLGQHFLKDQRIIQKIMEALRQEQFNALLEVGPGGGALTAELLQLPGIDLKAVELDAEKVEYLLQHYPALQGRLIHRSFLDLEPPFDGPFVVIGNFPYNISTQILFHLLNWKDQVPVVIGMFQKEVAERVASREGNKTYGVLSILVQADYDVEYLFDVSPGCFNPPPKVMSGVIRLRRRKEALNMRSERHFRMLVKTAFTQRRKTLRNATRSLFAPETLLDPVFDKRPEMLSIADFADLTFKMNGA